MNEDNLFRNLGVEVILESEEAFPKIRETLTRIGVVSQKEKTLCQSALLLHKRGRYAIMMFKEMFILDGKTADITETDIARRNTIALLLEQWGLLKIKNKHLIEKNTLPLNQVKILNFKEKDEYNLVSKYTIGNKKR